MSSIFFAILAYIKNSILFYDNVYIIILFVTMLSAPRLARRYFKEALAALFIIYIYFFRTYVYVIRENDSQT